ncbi:MAG: galactose mutarotase [Oscillospiraceae bacterium]|nr:galactose mutarotase [Oscillospiraceae bacterium]
MSVKKETWGFYEGYAVQLFTLKNDALTVRLTNFGATLVGITAPDKKGFNSDIVLGYDSLDGYVNGKSYQGAVVGRYANRISGAVFTLNGQKYELPKNDGENCLHGGNFGYHKRVWEYETDEKKNSVTFRYRSPDGEEGFPAALNVSVRYTLTAKNKLKIKYEAVSNGDTIFNPTNHAYFNLKGSGSVLDTVLQMNAFNYTPFDEFNIPDGKIESVPSTPFNFLKPKRIGTDIENGKIDGYDHNFLLGEIGEMKKAAVAHDPESGRIMAVYTDMPAIQLYTAGGLSEVGKNGVFFDKFHGFCLETQFTPDTPNLPSFPSCVLQKGKKFKSTTVYAFGVK